jgi:hypothetical protein
MKKLAGLFFIVLNNCGHLTTNTYIPPPIGDRVEATIKPLLEEFLQDCKKFGTQDICDYNLSKLSGIVFADPSHFSSSTIGVCLSIPDNEGGKTAWTLIKIRNDTPDMFSDPEGMKGLIYHELGHCLLNKPHVDMLDIMYYQALPNEFYKNNVWNMMVGNFFLQSFRAKSLYNYGKIDNNTQMPESNDIRWEKAVKVCEFKENSANLQK